MSITYKIIGADGREYGPATLEEIRDWIVEGRVAQGTLVWKSDEAVWRAAGMWQELRWDLPAPPPLPFSQAAPAVQGPSSGGSGGTESPVIPAIPPARGSELPVRLAGIWPRLMAYVFDLFLLVMLLNLVLMPWQDWFEEVRRQVNSMDPAVLSKDTEKLMAFYKLVLPAMLVQATAFFLLSMVYYVGFHGSTGWTPGKLFAGIRVETEEGGQLGPGRAFLRYGGECLSWMVMGVGYLLVAFDPTKRALHDRLARTRVVYRE